MQGRFEPRGGDSLALVAEEFGISEISRNGLLQLVGARRKAAVATAVGRGTNRAGGLLAEAPTRAA